MAATASVCRLINQHLRAQKSARPSAGSESKGRETLDLIVFPELSVHPSDLFLLHQLSDATQANIFAGLTFQQNGLMGELTNQAVWLLRHTTSRGRTIVPVLQGKKHLTHEEINSGVRPWRPYQVLIQFQNSGSKEYMITGSICYDATDLSLAADLRDVTDAFVVTALNKDITTFDNMAASLNYHMYQPVMISNAGEFGGSTAQAPYRERYDQLIAHVHGTDQVAVSIFRLDLEDFRKLSPPVPSKKKKTAPAGYRGRES